MLQPKLIYEDSHDGCRVARARAFIIIAAASQSSYSPQMEKRELRGGATTHAHFTIIFYSSRIHPKIRAVMKAIHFIILWTAANTTNCSAPNSRQKSFLPSLVAGSDVPNTNTGEGKAKSCHVTESASADALIECFLRENVGGANDDTKKFHVHGWRWHTLSLVRDAGRLERLALQKIKPTGSDDITAFPTKSDTGGGDSDLDTAAEHVIGFNMKGLFAVEDELFFPWLRSKLVDESSSGVHAADLRSAFGAVLDGIDAERSFVRKLASQVVCKCVYYYIIII